MNQKFDNYFSSILELYLKLEKSIDTRQKENYSQFVWINVIKICVKNRSAGPI